MNFEQFADEMGRLGYKQGLSTVRHQSWYMLTWYYKNKATTYLQSTVPPFDSLDYALDFFKREKEYQNGLRRVL